MHIIAVGLNYRTAPVEIREKFAFATEQLPKALQQLRQTKSVVECVIVGTCNRTEIYVVVDRMVLCGHYVRSFMEEWFNIPRTDFNKHLYILEDRAAIHHLFRVTSGLDSMILGETQILGQIRDSFLLAQQEGTTSTLFNTLFKQAITLAKRAFSETIIGENPVSISYAAVELGKRILDDISNKNVLLIGAGKMGELTAKHLCSNGVGSIAVVNRTYEHAVELASKFNGYAGKLDEMEQLLLKADIVISSTGASTFVLTKEQLKAILPKRNNQPLFMIDIAVPRDLDPAISEFDNVFIYDIDDLQMIVETNLIERQKESVKIEEMIEKELESFELWFKRLRVGPVIQSLQTKSNQIHEQTFNNLLKKLPGLTDHEIKVIHKLTKSMMNQMLREPIQRLKEIVGTDNEEVLELFAYLFALEAGEQHLEKPRNQHGSESGQIGTLSVSVPSIVVDNKAVANTTTLRSGREQSIHLKAKSEQQDELFTALDSAIRELIVISS